MAVSVEPRLAALLSRFRLAGEVTEVARWPGGHINDNWRVDCRDGAATAAYLVQRLNPAVFPDPDAVMENVVNVSRHYAARLAATWTASSRRRAPTLVPARSGEWWVRDDEGAGWRAYEFITAGEVRERAETPRQAGQAARAFGLFLRFMADYHGPPIRETIPGFHDTAARMARLEAALAGDPLGRKAPSLEIAEAILAERALAAVLPPLLASGALPRRIVHNDAKISNVLFDPASGEALAVTDFDTVMPGTVLHDFGDLVRAVVSPSAEDETDLSRVEARADFFEALGDGYLSEVGDVLTATERGLLVFAGRLITLEQAARFLTDYLEGDRYYRVARPDHNLVRAHAQLALYASLTRRSDEFEAIVGRRP